jgi:hypothetical protein
MAAYDLSPQFAAGNSPRQLRHHAILGKELSELVAGLKQVLFRFPPLDRGRARMG